MSVIEEQGHRVCYLPGRGRAAERVGQLRAALCRRRRRAPGVEDFATTGHLRRDLGLIDAPREHPRFGCGPFV